MLESKLLTELSRHVSTQELVELTRKLISIPSHWNVPTQEVEVVSVLEDYFKEVPLGNGQVDFDGYLDALQNVGFDGFLTIEREVGDNPQEDIKEAIKFLKMKMERFLK